MLRVFLGHGAWGAPQAMAPWVDGLRSRGVDAHGVALPRGRAERGIVPFAAQLPDGPGVVVGGHSLGGRVATLLAAGGAAVPDRRCPLAAVLGLSYPLHPRGDPGSAVDRTAHWPSIGAPVLLLSGARDPYARLDLLEAAAGRLPDGQLVVYPGLGHDLSPVREDALDRIVAFLRSLDGGGPSATTTIGA